MQPGTCAVRNLATMKNGNTSCCNTPSGDRGVAREFAEVSGNFWAMYLIRLTTTRSSSNPNLRYATRKPHACRPSFPSPDNMMQNVSQVVHVVTSIAADPSRRHYTEWRRTLCPVLPRISLEAITHNVWQAAHPSLCSQVVAAQVLGSPKFTFQDGYQVQNYGNSSEE